MFTVSALVFTFSLYIYCDAAYVETLPKCSFKDTECMKGVFQNMMKHVGSAGLEEFGLPPLDPMVLKDISVIIMKSVTLTVTEGKAKGMSKCVFNKFSIDWEKERGFLNVTCDDLSVKGDFKLSGENPEFQSIIGSNSLNGQGRAKIKLTNTNINVEFTIYVAKENGEIYIKLSNKNIKYTYNIGQAHFITENIMIANNDFSQIIASYLNDNWRQTMEQFGSIIMDKALDFYVGRVSNVFDKIPANKYIVDNMSSYVRH